MIWSPVPDWGPGDPQFDVASIQPEEALVPGCICACGCAQPGSVHRGCFGGLFDWLTVALQFAGLRERVGNAPVAEPEAIPG